MTETKSIPPDLIGTLIFDFQKFEGLISEKAYEVIDNSIFRPCPGGEMTEQLGHSQHVLVMNASGNIQNGKSTKTGAVQTGHETKPEKKGEKWILWKLLSLIADC